ncbi:MAG: exonuclease domain-containing protein [Deltaproteobacteria bacterium]|nr:exonuclease domain-containing protein [Deltaproteobacteria bacterium]
MAWADTLYKALKTRPTPSAEDDLAHLLRRKKQAPQGHLGALLAAEGRFRREDTGWRALELEELHPDVPLADMTLAVVDLETTGGYAHQHSILEIGVAMVGPGGISTWETLVNPQEPIPYFIQQMTGITPDMVEDAPLLSDALPAFAAFVAGCPLAAHNAPFDFGFLNAVVAQQGLPALPHPRLCTLAMARRLYPQLPRKGLDALTEAFGITVTHRHRALGDALATAQLFQIMIPELALRGVTTLHQLVAFLGEKRRG